MRLSIIICTRNRAAALPACLDAVLFALNAVDGEAAELLVVNNGSTDQTEAVIMDYAGRDSRVKLVTEPAKGLSHARNAGLKTATGRLIVFTDDDCHPAPDYFVTVLRHDDADDELILRGGRVLLGDPSDQPFSILTREHAERWHREDANAAGRQLGGAIIGANMFMRRALAERIGPFDTRFGAGGPFLGGEEIDYMYRAYFAGYAIGYVPDAVIHHYHGRKALSDIRRLVKSYDYGDGALFAKYMFSHPGLLRPLWWDLKKALKEPFGGELCRPELGVSHWSRLAQVARGMTAYYMQILRSQVLRHIR